jgi:hypothetical protein
MLALPLLTRPSSFKAGPISTRIYSKLKGSYSRGGATLDRFCGDAEKLCFVVTLIILYPLVFRLKR